MALNGIETLVYRVEDLEVCTRYFEDFGLPLLRKSPQTAHFRLDEGSNVVLRHVSDQALPPTKLNGLGVAQTIWGVDREDSLSELAQNLERDRDVRRDADGTLHTVDDDGLAIGFRVFRRNPVSSAPDPVNSPGNINRLNRHRKWLVRARPKAIQHVVFQVPDYEQSWSFYRDRLNFRLSDVQRGFGIFGRCDGTQDHHNIYLLNARLPLPGLDGLVRFSHANYCVEDLDEVMVGTNYMERKGWPKSVWGLGRHRIASALFLYLPSPAGGEAEYGADSDALDDSWVPRSWEPLFGTATFMHNLQPWLSDAPGWDVQFVEGYTPAGREPKHDD